MLAGPPSCRPARRDVFLVVAAAVSVGVPWLLEGPGPLADDWVFLRNARFDGWAHAAGPRQAGRPGGALVYDLTFGLIGNHPLALALVQIALLATAAVALLLVCSAFVNRWLALTVALVWLAVPNHSALEHWFSTAQALAALAFLCLGIRWLALRTRRGATLLPAHVALALAVACYELTAAVALTAVLLFPPRPGESRYRRAAVGVGLVAVPIVWALTHRTVYARSAGWLDPTLVLPGNLSLGLAGYGIQGRLVTGLGLALVLVAAARWRSAGMGGLHESERMTLAGASVLVLGVLPAARFPTNFLGLDDRLTLVSGVGAAMVWVGGAATVIRAVGRGRLALVAGALVGALACIVAPVRVARERDYSRAADLAFIEAKRLVAATAGAPVVDRSIGLANVDRIYGLNDGWNASAAVQLLSGDPGRVVLTDGIGPDPADPTEAFHLQSLIVPGPVIKNVAAEPIINDVFALLFEGVGEST